MARILIVEDNALLAEILARVLALDGHDVAIAVGAQAGIRSGLADTPEVLIAAWRLRGNMCGGEVARRISCVNRRMRTIVITAHSEDVADAREYCDCIAAVLVKPFHKTEIVEAVREALALKDEARNEEFDSGVLTVACPSEDGHPCPLLTQR